MNWKARKYAMNNLNKVLIQEMNTLSVPSKSILEVDVQESWQLFPQKGIQCDSDLFKEYVL